MRLAIFGATGRTGAHLIEQALAAGHGVRALARDPSRLSTGQPELVVVRGDIRDADRVRETIAGQEAVLSVLGSTKTDQEVVRVGARQIVDAMQQEGVRRLIFLTGAGVKRPQDPSSVGSVVFVPLLKLLSPKVLADAEQAVATIVASDLDWTIVRVPRLGDGPPTGAYRHGYIRAGFAALARADVAGFMLQQLTDPRYIREAPIISY
jgi:putative NADH-flavin reductase